MAIPLKTQINKLLKELGNIPQEVTREINIKVDFVKLVQATHRAGKDPYGIKWVPRKIQYNHPIMRKSGKLYNNYNQTGSKKGTTVINRTPYAQYHQTGAGNLPVREILPINIIPKIWWDKIEKVWADVINKKNKK